MAFVTKSGRRIRVDFTFWVMVAMALFFTILAYTKGPRLPLDGLKEGGRLLWSILPALLLAFVVAGMITVVLPRDLLSQHLGEESGLRGLLLGTLAGALTPGGPFVQFPLVAALLKAGAGVGPVMAYLTAWSLLGVNRFLVFEVPLLGWKLAVARMVASLVFPIIIGMFTRFLWIRW